MIIRKDLDEETLTDFECRNLKNALKQCFRLGFFVCRFCNEVRVWLEVSNGKFPIESFLFVAAIMMMKQNQENEGTAQGEISVQMFL